MTIVTIEHLRSIPGYGVKPGFCFGKSREFFQLHNLDWYAFRHGGLPAEQFLETGDALAIALVEWAQKCEAQDGF